jgi:tRNA pseudouridine38-40 synthase
VTTYRLTVEYDGTDFHGWQVQPSVRTVAGTLRDAVRRITGEEPSLTAAGRTDAGAHAHGQVVGLTLYAIWEPERLHAALNGVLPPDVAVRAVALQAEPFDARRDAVDRTYRYVLVRRTGRGPILRRHAWTVGPLDVAAMRDAAASLVGTHDFAAFGGATRPGGSTVRTVEEVTVEEVAAGDARNELDLVLVTVRANAFLRGMMRAITGALVVVGQGRRPASWVGSLLTQGAGRPPFLPVAPARGLHQWSVAYGVAA